MPSRDVNAATRLAEASWRRDKQICRVCKIYFTNPTYFYVRSGTDQISNIVLSVYLFVCLLSPSTFTNNFRTE